MAEEIASQSAVLSPDRKHVGVVADDVPPTSLVSTGTILYSK